MSKSSTRRLADQARAAGYLVTGPHKWAGTRQHAYRVEVAHPARPGYGVTLPYHHIGRVERGTPCWVEIVPGGRVTIAGAGYSSGRWFPGTLAGIEAARIAILSKQITRIAEDMREWGAKAPEALTRGEQSIAEILRLMTSPAERVQEQALQEHQAAA